MGELPRSFTHKEDTISSPVTLLDLLSNRAGAWKQNPLCCVKLNSPLAAGDFPHLRRVVLFGVV